MITVYLVQHGIALAKDVDAQRPLSDIGINESRQMAAILEKQGVAINKIVHSGKLRAQQTASIFADALNISELSTIDGMKPNDEPEDLIQKMTEDAVMYVGHLPHVQNVVSSLVSSVANKEEISPVLQFKNSAVACIEIEKDGGHIKWFLTPEICIEGL